MRVFSKLNVAIAVAAMGVSSGAMALPKQAVIYPESGVDGHVLVGEINSLGYGDIVASVQRWEGDEIITVRMPVDADESHFMKVMTLTHGVALAEWDRVATASYVPNDPSYVDQWSLIEELGGISATNAHNVSLGEGSVVAVVDTGYTPHSDLDANRLPGVDMISHEPTARDGDGRDADPIDEGDYSLMLQCNGPHDSSWHGTHVAGIVSAVTDNGNGIAAVAPGSKHIPVRALGHCGGYSTDIAASVIWAAGGQVELIPENESPADVINLSLGGPGSCPQHMQNAVNFAVAQGSVVVVAAGNEGDNADNHFPASCENVIAVAAVDRDGTLASYSNTGNAVDIASSGGRLDRILSTLNDGDTTRGNETYGEYIGTSMATPHVAGIAALLKSMDRTLTHDDVEQLLTETAKPYLSECSGCGAGIADADRAVRALQAQQEANEEPGEEPGEETSDEETPDAELVAYGGEFEAELNIAQQIVRSSSPGRSVASIESNNAGTMVQVLVGVRKGSKISMTMTAPGGQAMAVEEKAFDDARWFMGRIDAADAGEFQVLIDNGERDSKAAVFHLSILQFED